MTGTRRIVQFAFDYARRQRPPQGDLRPQGEHHEAHRRPVARAWRARSRRRTPTSSSTTGSWTTCACSSCRSPSSTTCWCCRTSTATSSPTSAPAWSAASGVAPGANFGDAGAVFEPTHGSRAEVRGPEQGQPDRDDALRRPDAAPPRASATPPTAWRARSPAVIAEGRSVTYDMKPSPDDPTAVGTSQVADAIVEQMGVRA